MCLLPFNLASVALAYTYFFRACSLNDPAQMGKRLEMKAHSLTSASITDDAKACCRNFLGTYVNMSGPRAGRGGGCTGEGDPFSDAKANTYQFVPLGE